MDIRLEAPPADVPRRGKNKTYKRLFEAVIAAKGDWVAVDAENVAGRNAALKRVTLKAVSKWWQVDTEVAITDETVYVRAVAALVEKGQ